MPNKTIVVASFASLCIGSACGGSTQQATTPRALVAATTRVAPDAAARPKFPPEARRKTPPTGIEAAALQVGALVPELQLPDDRDGMVRLGGNAPRPTLLLFYRGHW